MVPKLWIKTASATVYRNATDRPQDEYTGEYENDFSVQDSKNGKKFFTNKSLPIIRTETELILKSRWVIPTKLLESGFAFKFPEIETAFRNLMEKIPRKAYHLF